MEFAEHYGISEVTGFRAGYAGLVEGGPEPITLTPTLVHGINRQGGTMLGTSRGAQVRTGWSTSCSSSASTCCS